MTASKIDPRQRLELMLADMDSAPPLYRPTNFWQSVLPRIVNDLKQLGFTGFRSHPSAGSMYVPLFRDARMERAARPVLALLSAGTFSGRVRRLRRIFKEAVDGTDEARRMYQLYIASLPSPRPAWGLVSEDEAGGGERVEFDKRRYSKSLLNYLLGLNFLSQLTGVRSIASAVEIGGGYGTLGEILLKSDPNSLYINVDIPPVAAVSSYYLEQVFGADAVLTYEQSANLDRIDISELKGRYRAVVLCPWQLPKLVGQVDLFANFFSFQEMEPAVVENYIGHAMRLKPSLVLLRNSRLGKTKVAEAGRVGVFEPVTTDRIIGWFDQYALKGRDSFVFGAESRDGNFWSEVICMERRS